MAEERRKRKNRATKKTIMSKEDNRRYPVVSTAMGIGVGVFFNGMRRPGKDGVEAVRRFFRYSLVDVDAVGDGLNYPKGSSRIEGTIRNYHPDLFAGDEVVTVVEFERRLKEKLKVEGIPLIAKDWFVTNIVWEYLMGGGTIEELPNEWKKDEYLRVNLNGRQIGCPTDKCVVSWNEWAREERIFVYRVVTGYKFTETFLRCLGPEFRNVESVFGATTIYQIMTDRYHCKNPGEPLFSELVDEIRKRCDYSDWEEARLVGRMTRIWPILTMAGTVAAGIICRAGRGREEWAKRQCLVAGEL